MDDFKIKVDIKLPSIPWYNGAENDPVNEFAQFFYTDDTNLTTTVTKFVALFEALEGLPTTTKPVIVIGMVSRVVESILAPLFSECS